MNVYQKLTKARKELSDRTIKKSGHNKHLDFRYSELDDFMPHVLDINNDVGLFSYINFIEDNKKVVLCVVNTEKPDEQIFFESDTAEAKLQGKPNPIQELGSMHTYMRRYMYQLAYEITEGDSVNPNVGKPEPKINASQVADALSLLAEKGRDREWLETEAKCKLTELPVSKYEGMVKWIEKNA